MAWALVVVDEGSKTGREGRDRDSSCLIVYMSNEPQKRVALQHVSDTLRVS